MATQEDYYNNDPGGYQYLKLSELTADFELQSHDNESHLFGMPRSVITRNAKAALKVLQSDTAKEIKALELSIGDDFVFKLPQDYVDYVRVSLVTSNNTLQPLDINTKLNVSRTYLQDNEFNILFDGAGKAIEADGNNLTNKPYRSTNAQGDGLGGAYQLDTSDLSRNGEFVIDKRAGVIFFGSNMAEKDIVLEYVSDGMEWERLQDTEITFHKHLHQALDDLTYYKCIERRKNVPANEKYRAKNQMMASVHQAKIKLANFDLQAIARVWRKGSKWVKG